MFTFLLSSLANIQDSVAAQARQSRVSQRAFLLLALTVSHTSFYFNYLYSSSAKGHAWRVLRELSVTSVPQPETAEPVSGAVQGPDLPLL